MTIVIFFLVQLLAQLLLTSFYGSNCCSNKLERENIQKELFQHLHNISIPRPVGSANHEKVANYIKDTILNCDSDTKWIFKSDEFEQATPKGKLKFKNLIFTLDNNSASDERVIISAHYDSLQQPENFEGCIDSATSIAIILKLIPSLQKFSKINFQVIFFDGEESIGGIWKREDSLYGSRHLAAVFKENNDRHFDLKNISLFILLDLLGSNEFKANCITNTTSSNSDIFFNLLLKSQQKSSVHIKNQPFLMKKDETINYFVDDDHQPFLELRPNLPVLHLIPLSFPSTWHTLNDNISNINIDYLIDYYYILDSFFSHLNFRDFIHENDKRDFI